MRSRMVTLLSLLVVLQMSGPVGSSNELLASGCNHTCGDFYLQPAQWYQCINETYLVGWVAQCAEVADSSCSACNYTVECRGQDPWLDVWCVVE
jgi:hypothetical protein